MYKKILLFLILIFFIFVTILKWYEYEKIEYIKENYNDLRKKDVWFIEIEKINVKGIVKPLDIRSKVIKGIVLFENYGRPNIKYSNTVIGSHSGNSVNSYFKDLDKLELNDEIILYYEGSVYKYVVIDSYQVIETNLTPLNNVKDKTTITLITCNKYNSNYRIIVVGELNRID